MENLTNSEMLPSASSLKGPAPLIFWPKGSHAYIYLNKLDLTIYQF